MISDEARLIATRAETIESLKREGFHRKFPTDDVFLLNLREWLHSLDGGNHNLSTSKAIVLSVSRFLYFHQREKLDPTFLTQKRAIKLYCNAIKNRTTASASLLLNILNSLKEGSAYVSDTGLSRLDSHMRICRYIDHLKTSLQKLLAKRKEYNRRQRLPLEANIPDICEVGKKMKNLAPSILDMMSNHCLTAEEVNTVSSYLITRLAIENAARPSHVTNFSLGEFSSGEKFGAELLCQCAFAKNGHAPITFSEEMFLLTRKYVKDFRPKITGASQHDTSPLFVNQAGYRMRNMSSGRRVYKILKLAGLSTFSLTKLRKALTTKASRSFSDTPARLQLINRYLCHSDSVAQMYYTEGLRSTEYLQAFQVLQQLLNE